MSTVYTRTINQYYEYDATTTSNSGTWNNFALSIQQVMGAVAPTQGAELVVHYLVSAINLGNSISTAGLGESGRIVLTITGAASTTTNSSFTVPLDGTPGYIGSYLYVWISHDICGQPFTLTITGTSGTI